MEVSSNHLTQLVRAFEYDALAIGDDEGPVSVVVEFVKSVLEIIKSFPNVVWYQPSFAR